MAGLNVDDLAQEIRRVDGDHSLGAGALAEALMPFLARYQPVPSVSSAGAGDAQVAEDAGILADIAARLRAEILHQAEDGADWYDERPNRMLLAVEMELDLEALARSALPLPARPAQGKPE